MKKQCFIFLAVVAMILLVQAAQEPKAVNQEAPVAPTSAFQVSSPLNTPAEVKPAPDFGRMPLYFIENRGQTDTRVAYYVQGVDKSLGFTSRGMTVVFNRTVKTSDEFRADQAVRPQDGDLDRWIVNLEFVGSNPDVHAVGQGKNETVVSYFQGPPEEWHTGLPTYAKIVYPDLWPGIDLVYSGSVHRLKYEFIVRPGADPAQIRLAYRGASDVYLTNEGRLEVTTPLGSFQDDVPVAYQAEGSQKTTIPLSFALLEKTGKETAAQSYVYGFEVGDYDRSLPLVLDPAVFMYCGYIGGSAADASAGIAVDSSGNVYITGNTRSTQATFPETVGPDLTHNGGTIDAFVAKVKPDGTGLVYCGYIGGSNADYGTAVAVDGSGNAYVTGYTASGEGNLFPVTVGPDLTFNGSYDVFIAKVNASGASLAYCGYIGGWNDDRGNGIAVDGSGNAYIIGQAGSPETSAFPVVVGPDLTHNSPGLNDAFVAKINASGASLAYCGYIGGGNADYGRAIAVDSSGCAYVTGQTVSPEATFPVAVGPDLTFNSVGLDDAFVAKVAADGTGLVYCGYIGGSGFDYGYGIAVDASGNAYVGGDAQSTQATFPETVGPDLTHNGDVDSFVAKVAADGAGLVYCGYVGGSGTDHCYGLAVDGSGNAYLTGTTSSTAATFPVVSGPDFTHNGSVDGYVAKVNAGGTALMYNGYIGGLGADYSYAIAVDIYDNACITGYAPAASTDFPVAVGPDLTQNGDNDVFVAKFTSPFVVSKHAVGDFDGDGTDELAVDFGASGVYLWDNSTWTMLSALNTESMQAADTDGDSVDEIILDFGTLGLFIWDGGSVSQVSGVNIDVYAAGDVDADGSDEIVGDFGPSGLWLYDGGAWTQLSGVNADYMTVANLDGSGGKEIIGDFGPTGMWIWNAGAWTQLSGVNADYMTSGNTDGAGGEDLIGDFSGTGLWLYSNTLWTQLSGVNTDYTLIAATDLSGDDIVGDFSQTGLWLWDGTTWTILSGVNAEGMIRANVDGDANDELMVDFGSLGMWLWDSGAWNLKSGVNPEYMMTGDLDGDSQDEVLADFGSLGLWMWDNDAWTQISPLNPQ